VIRDARESTIVGPGCHAGHSATYSRSVPNSVLASDTPVLVAVRPAVGMSIWDTACFPARVEGLEMSESLSRWVPLTLWVEACLTASMVLHQLGA
jgi:hypothetical protein